MDSNPDTQTDAEHERQTEAFFKTDGPKPGVFASTIPQSLLDGQPKAIQELMNLTSVISKQNEYQIEQIEGLKSAHKTIAHRMNTMDDRLREGEKRFSNIDATLDIFTKLREAYLKRRFVRTKIAMGCLGFALTVIGGPLLVAWISHHYKW